MRLIISLLFLCVGASSQAQEKGKPERYQLFFSPHARADTYLVDTETGKVWQQVEGEEKQTFFQRVPVEGDELSAGLERKRIMALAKESIHSTAKGGVAQYNHEWSPKVSNFDFKAAMKRIREQKIHEEDVEIASILAAYASAEERARFPEEEEFQAAVMALAFAKPAGKIQKQIEQWSRNFNKKYP